MKRVKQPARYSLEHVEKLHILHVLSLAGGNKTLTAEWLGIGIRTLQRKLIKWHAEACVGAAEAALEEIND